MSAWKSLVFPTWTIWRQSLKSARGMLNRVNINCLQCFQLDADDYQLYSVTDRNKKPTKLKENLPHIKNRNTQPEPK